MCLLQGIFLSTDLNLQLTYNYKILFNLLQFTTILVVINPLFDNFWLNFV